jgi:hypothetical protein
VDEVKPITRESFLAAYVDENPWAACRYAAIKWVDLHARDLESDEIDEDPPQ